MIFLRVNKYYSAAKFRHIQPELNHLIAKGAVVSRCNTCGCEAAIDYFFAQHRELLFYQQTDRSTMTHINQVSAIYQDTLHSTGAFPGDEEIALEFDLRLNRDWRCRKGEPFDLQVDEKMLLSWMTQYSGNTYSEAEQALAQIKDVRRTMLMGGTELHDMPQTASEQGNNIILIDDYRKAQKRR